MFSNRKIHSSPVTIDKYTLDVDLAPMNRLLSYTVFIGEDGNSTLLFICNGIILPLSFLLTCYIGYKTVRVAFMKHLIKLELIMIVYSFVETILMLGSGTLFALYYWVWGAVSYEKEFGTPKALCIFYLYVFNFIPGYFFTLSKATIGFLIVFNLTKSTYDNCWLDFNTSSICTMYVLLCMMSITDFVTVFIITSVFTIDSEDPTNYQSKCFVVMSPLFDYFNIITGMKIGEWIFRILTHSLPNGFCVLFLYRTVAKFYRQSQKRKKGNPVIVGEKQRYTGCIIVIFITMILMVLDMWFNLFCDFYEIFLHFYTGPTNQYLFFSLRNIRTLLRTAHVMICPFQQLALCSMKHNFQGTMLNYLNGLPTKFATLKTIGGDSVIKVYWESLPELMSLEAQMYYGFLRCYPAWWIWNYFSNRNRDKKIGKLQNRATKELKKELRQLNKNMKKKESYQKSEKSHVETSAEMQIINKENEIEEEKTEQEVIEVKEQSKPSEPKFIVQETTV